MLGGVLAPLQQTVGLLRSTLRLASSASGMKAAAGLQAGGGVASSIGSSAPSQALKQQGGGCTTVAAAACFSPGTSPPSASIAPCSPVITMASDHTTMQPGHMPNAATCSHIAGRSGQLATLANHTSTSLCQTSALPAAAVALQHGQLYSTVTPHSASCINAPDLGSLTLDGEAGEEPVSDAEWTQVLDIIGGMVANKNKPGSSAGWRDAFEHMPRHLERVGLGNNRIAQLSVIHVAGTKGKGSTCAMTEAVLRSCGYTTGLFTSPHLVDVRERVRINGRLPSKASFRSHFLATYHSLAASASQECGMPSFFAFMTLLGLRMFLAAGVDVVVLEVGIGGRLDATNIVPAPVVCGVTSLGFDHMELLGYTLGAIAGEKAGIFKPGRPALTVPQPPEAMNTLQQVAAQVGTPLTQPPMLDAYSSSNTAAGGSETSVRVGLGGEHMRTNAALAVRLASEWESQFVSSSSSGAAGKQWPEAAAGAAARVEAVQQLRLPDEYVRGLESVTWAGRSQVAVDTHPSSSGRLTFYLDGAHTIESMATCAQWFVSEQHARLGSSASGGSSTVASRGGGSDAGSASGSGGRRDAMAMVFSCMRDRDPAVLLPALTAALSQAGGSPPAAALFTPALSVYGTILGASGTKAADGSSGNAAPEPAAAAAAAGPEQDLSWQEGMLQVWTAAGTATATGSGSSAVAGLPAAAVIPTLPSALAALRQAVSADPSLHLHVLITGSLYLVGDVLRLLGHDPAKAAAPAAADDQ